VERRLPQHYLEPLIPSPPMKTRDGIFQVGGIFGSIFSIFLKYPQNYPLLIQAVARISWTLDDE
jgi:hypothetical protein